MNPIILILAALIGAAAGWWLAQGFRVGTGRFWTSRPRRNGERPWQPTSQQEAFYDSEQPWPAVRTRSCGASAQTEYLWEKARQAREQRALKAANRRR